MAINAIDDQLVRKDRTELRELLPLTNDRVDAIEKDFVNAVEGVMGLLKASPAVPAATTIFTVVDAAINDAHSTVSEIKGKPDTDPTRLTDIENFESLISILSSSCDALRSLFPLHHDALSALVDQADHLTQELGLVLDFEPSVNAIDELVSFYETSLSYYTTPGLKVEITDRIDVILSLPNDQFFLGLDVLLRELDHYLTPSPTLLEKDALRVRKELARAMEQKLEKAIPKKSVFSSLVGAIPSTRLAHFRNPVQRNVLEGKIRSFGANYGAKLGAPEDKEGWDEFYLTARNLLVDKDGKVSIERLAKFFLPDWESKIPKYAQAHRLMLLSLDKQEKEKEKWAVGYVDQGLLLLGLDKEIPKITIRGKELTKDARKLDKTLLSTPARMALALLGRFHDTGVVNLKKLSDEERQRLQAYILEDLEGEQYVPRKTPDQMKSLEISPITRAMDNAITALGKGEFKEDPEEEYKKVFQTQLETATIDKDGYKKLVERINGVFGEEYLSAKLSGGKKAFIFQDTSTPPNVDLVDKKEIETFLAEESRVGEVEALPKILEDLDKKTNEIEKLEEEIVQVSAQVTEKSAELRDVQTAMTKMDEQLVKITSVKGVTPDPTVLADLRERKEKLSLRETTLLDEVKDLKTGKDGLKEKQTALQEKKKDKKELEQKKSGAEEGPMHKQAKAFLDELKKLTVLSEEQEKLKGDYFTLLGRYREVYQERVTSQYNLIKDKEGMIELVEEEKALKKACEGIMKKLGMDPAAFEAEVKEKTRPDKIKDIYAYLFDTYKLSKECDEIARRGDFADLEKNETLRVHRMKFLLGENNERAELLLELFQKYPVQNMEEAKAQVWAEYTFLPMMKKLRQMDDVRQRLPEEELEELAQIRLEEAKKAQEQLYGTVSAYEDREKKAHEGKILRPFLENHRKEVAQFMDTTTTGLGKVFGFTGKVFGGALGYVGGYLGKAVGHVIPGTVGLLSKHLLSRPTGAFYNYIKDHRYGPWYMAWGLYPLAQVSRLASFATDKLAGGSELARQKIANDWLSGENIKTAAGAISEGLNVVGEKGTHLVGDGARLLVESRLKDAEFKRKVVQEVGKWDYSSLIAGTMFEGLLGKAGWRHHIAKNAHVLPGGFEYDKKKLPDLMKTYCEDYLEEKKAREKKIIDIKEKRVAARAKSESSSSSSSSETPAEEAAAA